MPTLTFHRVVLHLLSFSKNVEVYKCSTPSNSYYFFLRERFILLVISMNIPKTKIYLDISLLGTIFFANFQKESNNINYVLYNRHMVTHFFLLKFIL
jgi:hypothetical protein